MKDRIALLVAALWWGSLTTIGFLVVPMLFAQLGNPAIAGNFAGRLFSAQSWVALACGLALLTYFRSKIHEHVDTATRVAIGWILVALLLALLQEYAVAPRILARDNLRLWHSLGSAMYLGQWLCAGVLLWRMGRQPG
ncbi:DUF4149 domain-containing protein [Variovorax sp. JS1663]|uniref:DUF4149 domain-containing protein n=1 Tax=Variovorax sp. JS1663 TaxID=1851577 RepID=UPI000B348100|nr:DUF4149 domain-containing protein [Variovorax sp. JS1663]OUM01103.1 hypothetical protein A8M77_17510 [Variovorax sp. JS1663]